MNRLLFLFWLVLSVLWVAGVGYYAYTTWPHLSLDLSHIDAETQAAYRQATTMHVLKYVAVAVLVPGVIGLVGWYLMGRR